MSAEPEKCLTQEDIAKDYGLVCEHGAWYFDVAVFQRHSSLQRIVNEFLDLKTEKIKAGHSTPPAPPPCLECDGTGAVDSGGVTPWMAPIDIECPSCQGTGRYIVSANPQTKRYCPQPNTLYLCVYCNNPTRLRDADVVVDSYSNVCHYECFMEEVAPNVSDAPPLQPSDERADHTRECKEVFLRVLTAKYSWVNWMVTDNQMAVIIDAMEAWQARASLERKG